MAEQRADVAEQLADVAEQRTVTTTIWQGKLPVKTRTAAASRASTQRLRTAFKT